MGGGHRWAGDLSSGAAVIVPSRDGPDGPGHPRRTRRTRRIGGGPASPTLAPNADLSLRMWLPRGRPRGLHGRARPRGGRYRRHRGPGRRARPGARRRSTSPGCPSCSARGWPPAGSASRPTPPRPRAPTCTSSASAPPRSTARTPRTCATCTPRSRTCCRTCARATSWSASPPSRSAPRSCSPSGSPRTAPEATLIWNPEFLREGKAVQDTLTPDRFVYGVPDGEAGERAAARLDEVYATALGTGTPRLVTDLATAQLVKVAANSFLATKISFINAMAELCEVAGADVDACSRTRSACDDRIGRKFLNAGVGFGGGCLPKDIRAFMARAGELGADQALTFLREVDAINMRRRVRMVDLAREECGGSIVGRRIAVLGAAFKPESDDVRDSPALSVAAQMQLQGAEVTGHRPAGHRQRPQEVARPALRGDGRGGRRGRRARAGADRVGGVRRRSTRPRSTGQVAAAADPRRAQLPGPAALARRRLDLPRARSPLAGPPLGGFRPGPAPYGPALGGRHPARLPGRRRRVPVRVVAASSTAGRAGGAAPTSPGGRGTTARCRRGPARTAPAARSRARRGSWRCRRSSAGRGRAGR